MSSYTDLLQQQILTIGAAPQWQNQSATPADYTGSPGVDQSKGVALTDAVTVYVAIALREDPSKRTARVTMAAFDATATYTVTIGTTPCQVSTPADESALLTGLRDAINSAAGATVTAIALDATGADVATSGAAAKSVRVQGDTEADFGVGVSATNAGQLSAVVDAVSATARVWGWPGGRGRDSNNARPERWYTVPGGKALALDQTGFLERMNFAGASRAYVELVGVTGDSADTVTSDLTYQAVIDLGPAVLS
ncbi:MAG: hypothetical protein AAFV53_33325 [Myxococcota bacterium]